jgi:hypothetical protein
MSPNTTCVLTSKPDMRGGGQRTQPLGIRQETRLSPSQTCSIPSSSVSRARCGYGLSRRSLPSMFHWVPFWTVTRRCLSAARKRLVASTAVRLLKRAEPAGARRGKPRGIFRAHSSGPLPEVHAPLTGPGGLWHNTSADLVHDASCGHMVLPLTAVDNSSFSPTHLTILSALLTLPLQNSACSSFQAARIV